MTELEQGIEDAAEVHLGGPIDEYSPMDYEDKIAYSSFKQGAKSFAAKAFHQQGMYTEQEVKLLLGKLYQAKVDGLISTTRELDNWFEPYKKCSHES